MTLYHWCRTNSINGKHESINVVPKTQIKRRIYWMVGNIVQHEIHRESGYSTLLYDRMILPVHWFEKKEKKKEAEKKKIFGSENTSSNAINTSITGKPSSSL